MANFVYEYNDKRAIDGVGGALYYKTPSDSLYSFAFACDSVPTVRGEVESHEFSLITSRTKGQTQGQMALEKKDIPVIWHRDLIERLKTLSALGEIEFLAVAQDYSADKFTATLTYKRDDMGNDTLKGMATIIPSSTEFEYIPYCKKLLKDTVKFVSDVPNEVVLAKGDSVATVNVQVTTSATVTCEVVEGSDGATASTKATASWTNGVLTITAANTGVGAVKEYLLVKLTASLANYQSWTCSIAVEVGIGTTEE